ncbi:cellulose biosynthesis protein BcsS [Methylobacterium iners]|uniref:Cellulose biosynthesis protein BcsS n=1 Tax=Methylobacterium iners TaxID=418707 RepID=A0ABQ4RYE1_9HYPH|nr:cellulose biosynthesis protein BcsS [Methylobacterium iners]GJD95858.1 hypothetical protein OCOJLMKI_3074 [Methylobacterium iners]
MQQSLLWLTAAFAVLYGASAHAADWYRGAEPSERSDDWIVAVDASTTLSSQGSQFAGATLTAAPVGTLTHSGPRLRFDGLIGSYRSPTVAGRATIGQQAEVAAMAGYAWVWPDAVLSAFVGLNVRHNAVSGLDLIATPAGTEVGAKAALDLYARPSARTMIHATGSYATTFNAYFGRVRAGMATFAGGYVGPEFALLGDDFYRQWRVGAHLSGMQVGAVQFGLAAGYLHDQANKAGFYTTVDMRAGF